MMTEKELEMFKKRRISNWSKASNLAYSTEEPEKVYDLMLDEIRFYNRAYHVLRLYQRYNNLRRRIEMRDLHRVVKDEQSDTSLNEHLNNHIRLNLFFDTNPSLQVLRKLLKTELEGQNRPYITRKIYGHYYRYRSIFDKEVLGIPLINKIDEDEDLDAEAS